MLNILTEFALARRWFVLALALVLAGLGVRAFQQIPIDAFPDVSTTQVKLILKAPGMTPEEVEARITQPVETELLGIPHQTILRSQSKNALVDITVDFEEGTDIYWARQQVSERFANVKGDLPPNVSGGLAPISTPLSELFMFTIEGPLSLAEKRTLLDWTVRPQLRALPGVADVNSLGGRVATFSVSPDPAALAARGVTYDELRAALESNTRNNGAGRVNEGEETWVACQRRRQFAGRFAPHRHQGGRWRGRHRRRCRARGGGRAGPLRRGDAGRPGRGGGRSGDRAERRQRGRTDQER